MYNQHQLVTLREFFLHEKVEPERFHLKRSTVDRNLISEVDFRSRLAVVGDARIFTWSGNLHDEI